MWHRDITWCVKTSSYMVKCPCRNGTHGLQLKYSKIGLLFMKCIEMHVHKNRMELYFAHPSAIDNRQSNIELTWPELKIWSCSLYHNFEMIHIINSEYANKNVCTLTNIYLHRRIRRITAPAINGIHCIAVIIVTSVIRTCIVSSRRSWPQMFWQTEYIIQPSLLSTNSSI